MSMININNLTFSYEGSYDEIFSNVSFRMDTNWKLGFCGRNGRGKTTFLHLLMGKYEYKGKISSEVSFEYFPFPVEDKIRQTLVILQQIAPSALLWQIQREISLLEVEEEVLYRPFATLSPGEQTKVMLAGLFLRENSFLLIDEPTNHLDAQARKVAAEYLRSKQGFILVSHDRVFLDQCIDHILYINNENIEVQKGNFSSWYHNKQLRDNYEIAENERLKKEVRRLESAAKQSEKWANKVESAKMGKGAAKIRKQGHDNADTMAYNSEQSRRMQQRRKNLEHRQQRAIEEKSALLKNIETAEALKLSALDYHSDTLLSFRNVSAFYGEKEVFSNLSFEIKKGERVSLFGGNGSGKSTVLKLICGEKIPHSGEIKIGGGLIISYVPQDTSFLSGDLKSYARAESIDEPLFKAILRKLDFPRSQFDKNMEDFSAGQKKKVLLAKSLCQKAHLYIWDEPLNYIDLLSRVQIEELILQFKPTLLFVEHDQAFCDKIGEKQICQKVL